LTFFIWKNKMGFMQASVRMKLNSPLLPILTIIVLVVRLLDSYDGWTLLLVGLGGAWIVSWLWARSLARGLRLHREIRFGWVQVGDRLEERFTLVNESFFPALWVEVEDQASVPGYQASSATGVGGRSENQWLTEGVCRQRGLFQLGPTYIRSADPLSIYSIEIIDPRTTRLLVVPPVIALARYAAEVGGLASERRSGVRALERSVSTSTVRPYLPGDSLHLLHWKTTARLGDLHVRQLEEIPAGDWMLILDLDHKTQLGAGKISTHEHAIILAASLASQGLRDGKAVGLTLNAQDPVWLAPSQGEGQRWLILKTLALASASRYPLVSFFPSIPFSFSQKACPIIITANPDPEWIKGLVRFTWSGIKPFIYFLNPESYGASFSLKACHDLLVSLALQHQVFDQAYFDRPETSPGKRGEYRWRITPFGRAVSVPSGKDEEWRSIA
jgi:uncharacterized protein (DUF58 family)